MKEVKTLGAQGELVLRRITRLPGGVRALEPSDGRLIAGHSETGHHHVFDATGCKLYQGENSAIAYLVAETVEFADLVHLRTWDTHETLRLCGEPGAVWEIRRQEEFTPEGWKRVVD